MAQANATVWQFRCCIIVPIALKNVAAAWAAQLDPDVGGSKTFDFWQASLTGNAPATHVYANVPMTAAMLTPLAAIIAGATVPGTLCYRWAFDTGALTATNSLTAALKVGQVWNVQASLADANLKQIGG